ncbi:hypothetical protein HN51_001725 [Arachis hypogaea]
MSDSLVRVSRRAEWEPTGRRPECAGAKARQRARAAFHNRNDDVSAGLSTARAWATVTIRVGRRPESIGRPASPFHIRPGRIAGPHPFPSRQFQALFDFLFKGCIPKQPDAQTAPRGATGSGHNEALTLSGAPFQGTWAWSATEDASPDYNSDARGDRFSCWALPAPPDLRSRSGRSTSAAGRRALNRERGTRGWPRGLFSTTICRGAAPQQEPVSLNQPRARGSREANVRPSPCPGTGETGGFFW